MENLVTHAASAPEKIVYERHPELFFDDGDIVLQTKLPSSKGQQVLQVFCIHMSTLRFHSVVFANLFADGSGTLGPLYDGRPVVDMSDDAGDLAQLLSYVYKPSEYLLRPSHPDTPIELMGAVKLADKYLLDAARADMIRRVTMDWPVTLDEWDIRESGLQGLRRVVFRQYKPHEPAQRSSLSYHMPEPVSAIVFAQKHGCAEILPAAFYRLASIDVTSEWDGDRGDNIFSAVARWALCDNDNLKRYIKGRQALEKYHHEVAFKLHQGAMLSEQCLPWWVLDPPVPYDDDEEEDYEHDVKEYPCLHFLRTLCHREWEAGSKYDPLTALLKLDDEDKHAKLKKKCPKGLCDGCRYNLRRWVDMERAAVWKRLPAFFDLKLT